MTRRRSLLRTLGASIAGAGLLTGSAVAETGSAQSGIYYEILGDGTLRYIGPDETDEQTHLKAATSMFNAGKRRGDWSFRLPDERVSVVSEAPGASEIQSGTGSPRVRSASDSPGKSKYESEPHWQGHRHTFWFNDRQSDELRNQLVKGAGVLEMAAAVAKYFGAIGKAAAAAIACGGILAGGGATLINMNDEGKGVKLWFHAPNLLDFDLFEIRPQ